MTIKMLAGFAGADFSVSPGDITDRFSEAEEGRMIAAGYAEAADGIAVPVGPESTPAVEPVVEAVVEAVTEPAPEPVVEPAQPDQPAETVQAAEPEQPVEPTPEPTPTRKSRKKAE